MSRPLPVLKGLDATVIDGGGAILAATGDQAGGGAFVVASSDFTLRDLSFENFGTAVAVTPQGVRDLHDIRLTRLRIVTNSIGISIVGRDANSSVGTLRDIAISDSEFSGVPGPTGTALNGIRIEGMTQAGSEADDPVVDGVLVTRNRFGTGLLEGVDIAGFTGIGAASSPPPSANGGPLRNITISSNSFEDCLDVCVLGIAALAIGGNLSDVAITGLRVIDNDMTNGSGVFLVGGYALGAGATRNNAIRQIEIRGNRMRRSDDTRACLGLALAADLTDVSNGVGSGDIIEQAVIADNEVTGCRRGLLVAGAATNGTLATTMSGNAISDIRIVGNTIRDAERGIHISGADAVDGRLLGNSPVTGNPGLATMTGNEARDIELDGNLLVGNAQALLITGGSVIDANAYAITMNAVRGVRFSANSFRDNQSDCLVANDYMQGNTGSLVLGNSVEGAT